MTEQAKVEQRHREDYTASDSHEASALLSALRNMHCDQPHYIMGPPCARCMSTVHDALAKAICVIRAAGYAAGVKDERERCAKVCEALAERKGHVTGGRVCQYAAAIRARSDAEDTETERSNT